MRLIDADELINEAWNLDLESFYDNQKVVDMIEDAATINPPCNVGDKLYYAPYHQSEVLEAVVSMITIKSNKDIKIRLSYKSSAYNGRKSSFEVLASEIGNTLFYTQKEAKNALYDKLKGI